LLQIFFPSQAEEEWQRISMVTQLAQELMGRSKLPLIKLHRSVQKTPKNGFLEAKKGTPFFAPVTGRPNEHFPKTIPVTGAKNMHIRTNP
jgi:hypothetical protein